ncbi:DnaJ protein, putative [Babesia caballi]|uniref:DnaJ protein, putative n=1 Tax=Babesia caballi TaxID=5871 RepID=A0AAV4LYP3_BABCB|nr:DnaJ protein, putative [Babesia caballi]
METTARRRNSAAGQGRQKQSRATSAAKKSDFSVLRFLRNNSLVLTLMVVVILGVVLKYFENSYHSMESFTELGEDVYSVMGIARDASDAQIKAKYRQLNHKWHPDKNPDCKDCKEKFMKLKAAYKILSNPELRRLYDRTNGRTVEVISSATTELTEANYDELVRNSEEVWVVQVYSDDLPECQHFAKHWEEGANKLGRFANFGRVNALLHPKTAKRLPIKVQLFPAVLILYPGGGHDIFPQDALRGYRQFKAYFMSAYPNETVTCRNHEDFKSKLAAAVGRPAVLFRGAGDNVPAPPPLLHAAMRYRWAFDTYWISSETPLHNDEAFMTDLMDASKGGNNMIASTAVFQLRGNLDAMAIFYGAGSSEMVSTAPYSRAAIDELHQSIESMLALAYPPLELALETFNHLCRSSNINRDRFCIIVAGGAHETFGERKVLEHIAKFEHGLRIGSVFSTQYGDNESAGPAAASADVQLVRLSESHSTPQLRGVVGSGVILLDAARGKFCLVVSDTGRYDCGVAEDAELSWVGDIAEGAFDTLSWYDLKQAFGGRFEDRCLLSIRPWYRAFVPKALARYLWVN